MIRGGSYVEVAAQACGVSKHRLYDWSAKAAEHDDATEEEFDALDDETALFVWFRHAYKEAEAQAETRLLLRVQQAGPRWQAYMTVLERRFGARWRRQEAVEHSGEVGVKKLDPSQVEEELAAFGMPAASAVAAGPGSVEAPEDA